MKDYRSYSYWLDSCGDDLTPRPALSGSIDVDVGILGAGFTGLWTAYYLLKLDPTLRVALIEREVAGFGASGRNGGWCTANFALGAAELFERYGAGTAHEVQSAMIDTVDEVGRVADAEGIDAQFRKGGELLLALGPQHLDALASGQAAFERIGLEEYSTLIDRCQLERRIRVAGASGALFMPGCAVIHPGKLVRGLARSVERHGGIIFEGTPVIDFMPGSLPRFATPKGEVRARTIVLAGEAYLTQLRPLHRQSLPVYSLIVLTEPISDALWAEIGWHGNECIASARYTIDYLSRTTDGRILFGGRGAPYHYASRIADRFDRHSRTHQTLKEMVVKWFPMLDGIKFSHEWGGPIAIARDWMPTIGYNAKQGLASARSYIGQGVATTNLAGRILADLIVGVESPISKLAIVGHCSPNWEIEPLRWLGVRYVQMGLQHIDKRAERSAKPPSGRSLAERLAGH